MKIIKAALLQMEVAPGNIDKNRATAYAMVQEAAKKGADIVVLPELWTTGYALRNVEEVAEPMDGSTITALRQMANTHNVNIVTGSWPFRSQGKIYNGAFVISRQGELVADYQKIHLFSLMGEERFFAPGSKLCRFALDDLPSGLFICYDLRFPELARKLTIEGAKLLFVPAEWPETRKDHWRALLIARAIENQAYVIAVNCVGQHRANQFAGHSMVVDPWGNVLVEGARQQELLIVDIDLAAVEQVRSDITALTDRRPEVYL